ncbi:Aste57867_12041 [Aphanomyces stellatus]|uniref:Aste57867_12041 protein n=1 Tax=Aphanomyces stellatus TaxID=120398 RepID=A0A485KWI4_9STRA|nr:hypothetical protein As57867_011996 [Aphanomyces stellatus]VFT88896.1 Aste57867_12041 [Aphanomyces stellatus]
MGAAGSVDALPGGARKLQYFVAMKAFNLRQAEAKSLRDQFTFLKLGDAATTNAGDEAFMDCDALCAYLCIPAPRRDALRQLFQVQADNRIKYADFLRFLEHTTTTTVPPSTREEESQPKAASSRAMPPRPREEAAAPKTSNNQEDDEPMTMQLARVDPIDWVKAGGSSLTPGLWKKREITIQERIVEYTKIDEHGVPQHLIEKERHQHEIIHMESTTGEFAHREITHFEQSEELNKEIVHLDSGKEEFVHLKSKEDEISHFESSMPQSRQPEACEQPPPSPTIKRDSSQSPLEPEADAIPPEDEAVSPVES